MSPFSLETAQLFGFATPSVVPPDDVNARLASAGGNLRESLGPLIVGLSKDDHESRTRWALNLGLPGLARLQDKYLGQGVMVCASGPSLDLNLARAARAKGFKLAAVNMTHDLMIAAGVVPDFALMVDPARRHAGYMTPDARVQYLFASILHPKVFQRFREAEVTPCVWIPAYSYGQDTELQEKWPDAEMVVVAGVTTVAFRAVNVLGFMGFQVVALNGVDSCYAPGCDGAKPETQKLYAPGVVKPMTQHDARPVVITSARSGRKLRCVSNGAMAFQLLGFTSILRSLPDTSINGRIGRLKLLVCGDGAIPWMAWADGGAQYCVEHIDPGRMAAKYGTAQEYDYVNSRAIQEAEQAA